MTTVHLGGATLRSIDDLRSSAGRLEALLNTGTPDAKYAVLICHPHPLGGGTMHNKVVYHAMKAFHTFGLPILRFNFRGTGLSEGEHDDGRGEREDVRAALDWLGREYGLPILFAGFSFGANVGLQVCCGDERVRGMVALGLPVHAEGRAYHYEFLAECRAPKLFISGTLDQYGPMEEVKAAVAHAPGAAQILWIEGAEHFFVGKLDQVQAGIRSWLTTLFLPPKVT